MRQSAISVATSMVGRQFGRLTVVSVDSVDGSRVRLVCACSCGGSRVARHDHIRSGATASCGCLLSEAKTTHGRTRSPEHVAWANMIARCEYEKSSHYARYGGRGITVCARWRESFAAFLEDMGPKPTAKHEIDRKDNDGNYEPNNCQWATRRTQMGNTSANRHITANGETLILQEWARRLGVTADAITMRITRGMPEAEAVTRPFRRKVA